MGSDESSSPKEKLDVRNRNISSDNILALANETKKSSGKDVQEKCALQRGREIEGETEGMKGAIRGVRRRWVLIQLTQVLSCTEPTF